KAAAFRAWVQAVAARGLPMWNRPEVTLWNMHKRYLLDLQARGVAIPRTILVEAGESVSDLPDLLDFEHVVVKPAISLNGDETYKLPSADRAAVRRAVQAIR